MCVCIYIYIYIYTIWVQGDLGPFSAFCCGGEGSEVRFRVHYMKVYGLGLLSVKGLGLGFL